jgi:hypothetical protein
MTYDDAFELLGGFEIVKVSVFSSKFYNKEKERFIYTSNPIELKKITELQKLIDSARGYKDTGERVNKANIIFVLKDEYDNELHLTFDSETRLVINKYFESSDGLVMNYKNNVNIYKLNFETFKSVLRCDWDWDLWKKSKKKGVMKTIKDFLTFSS